MYQQLRHQGYEWIASQPGLRTATGVLIDAGNSNSDVMELSLFSNKYEYSRLRSVVWQD